ncbi:MAG: hypothetical protein AUG91_10425 [Actinobacteria bacterium 13_1_20CM_4_69_9]|nr:MAG: hypothetical protein AUG91_10425 [Actinobacteria bacterium 13_1_20CM_4_69_9]
MAIVESNTELGRQVVEDAKRYVLHSWSVQNALDPIPVAGGEGRYFWDFDGKRYLDFASQLVNVSIGHQHPKVVAAIKEQAEKLCTIGPPMATEPRSTLARMLAEVTPGDLEMSFFTNGGAEANENAIRLARWYTGRHKIIARYRSYHGATGGAITLTGDPRRWPAEPGIPGVVRMLDPYTYRCPAGHPDPCPVCTGGPHLEEILQYEGPHTVAAVILETVTGTNGIIVPPDGYLQSIREVCDKYGILLIADEVMAGFGRTGKWFGVENWDVVPDILSVAKGINSGYIPLGAMIVRKAIADWLRDKYFAGGLTYSGHPLACASAVASIEAFKEEGIVEHAAEMGPVFAEQLRGLQDKHPSIGEVRGLGCFWGIELVKNRETREPLVPFNATGEAFAPVARVYKAALDRGLYLMTHWNVVATPPSGAHSSCSPRAVISTASRRSTTPRSSSSHATSTPLPGARRCSPDPTSSPRSATRISPGAPTPAVCSRTLWVKSEDDEREALRRRAGRAGRQARGSGRRQRVERRRAVGEDVQRERRRRDVRLTPATPGARSPRPRAPRRRRRPPRARPRPTHPSPRRARDCRPGP